MPLLDHFRPPLFPVRPWESFHTFWAAALGERLNRLLPPRYFAAIHTHLGTQVEADVAEMELTEAPENEPGNGAAGGVAVQTWAPPVAALTMPAVFPDDIEVRVIDTRDGARLVGVVELVSPGNLDRGDARRSFAAKCAAYLHRGIGLLTVDIVTTHHFNLHNELVDLLRLGGEYAMAADATLYAVAYAPSRRLDTDLIDAWPTPLAVGADLPLLPLALLGGRPVPVDLEATYTDARQRSRL